MAEDLKKELEGLSTEISEEISTRTEAFIEDLIEEGEVSHSGQPVSQIFERGKGYLIYLGIFLTIVGIGFGLFFLWNILNHSLPQRISKVTEEGVKGAPLHIESVSSEIVRAKKGGENLEKEKLGLPKEEKEKKYNYNLKLSNFLLPLDENTFLKVDVYLYYASYDNYKKALEREFDLRKFFYQELKKAEITVWKREQKVKEFEEKLRNLMKNENIDSLPDKLELESIILKT